MQALSPNQPHKVFLSHGHSPAWREVKDFIENECDPRLPTLELAGRAGRGRTIQQKLLEEADECFYAVIVMTGDDVMKTDEKRARENVVHEIGYFQGRFGHDRVCLMREDGVGMPSNLGGVAHISFPPGKIKAGLAELQRELRAAAAGRRKMEGKVEVASPGPPLASSHTSLVRAQELFRKRLAEVGQDETVELRHIGIDMQEAMHGFVPMLDAYCMSTFATVKLLVISGDADEFPKPHRKWVGPWTADADLAVEHIKSILVRSLDPKYKKRRQHLSVEIGRYAELPTIHGFSLYKKQGNKRTRIATYLSFCRWVRKGTELDWGGEHYREILEPPFDASSQDMIAIFEGAFDYLWATKTDSEMLEIGYKALRRGKSKRSRGQPA